MTNQSDVKKPIELIPVTAAQIKEGKFFKGTARVKRVLESSGFKAAPNSFQVVPNAKGIVDKVYVGISDPKDIFALSAMPKALPEGEYEISGKFTPEQLTRMTLGWSFGTYDFNRLKTNSTKKNISLKTDEKVDQDAFKRDSYATKLVRDLINTPANELSPATLGSVAEALLKKASLKSKFNSTAKVKTIVGEELLEQDFPLIHTVGRAADEDPRLVDFIWGDEDAPKITLVGKGVTYDTGGLDIKPSAGMRDMKKDMGGAAHVIALATMIMQANLPVRLRVLIPIVENSVSDESYRTGDVYRSKTNPKTGKSVSVEIYNTDAEGRLILADALVEAAAEEPDLLIDFATLTGAQRVAHGMEIGGIMGTNKQLERDLEDIGEVQQDYLARLPLHEPYRSALASGVADCQSGGGKAGSITAGLFLKQFTEGAKNWLHFDVSGWNDASKPGRPRGGEAFGIRSTYRMIEKKFTM